MKKSLLLLFLFTALLCKAQTSQNRADIFPDSCTGADIQVYGMAVDDTTKWCGYYSGFPQDTFLVIKGSINLANVTYAPQLDLAHPENNTAYLGIPNVTPGVYKNQCGFTWYKNFCKIEIIWKDKCGNEWVLFSNNKFYFAVAQYPGYWLTRNSDGTFKENGYCGTTPYLENMFGEPDTSLAYFPAITDSLQATLSPNHIDYYSPDVPRNSVVIDPSIMTLGETYYYRFTLNPFMLNQGLNLGKDDFTIPFKFLKHTVKATALNPIGYYLQITTAPALDPPPPAPASITVVGRSITWAKVDDACLYKIERAMSSNPSGKSFQLPVTIGLTPDNSFVDSQTLIRNRYYKYYVSAKTSGGWGEKIVSNPVRVK